MYRALILSLLIVATAACTSTGPVPSPVNNGGRPLETLPSAAGLNLVRSDLLATARERFGAGALNRSLEASTHLIVKRFAGMAPPPPPGAGPDWRSPTPTAVLLRERSGWIVATSNGWRPANPDAGREIDALVASQSFWTEPASTPPCPDFGASILLLKAPGKAETVRNALCTSEAAQLVEAALRS